jgi:RNA polymerase sigma-70 factor, ECF subfamily
MNDFRGKSRDRELFEGFMAIRLVSPAMPLTDPLADATLIANLRSGDAQAASALYRRHASQVFRFASLWAGNASMAADVTQEVFIHFFNKPEAFDPLRGSLCNWLIGVARNKAREQVRDDARYAALEFDEESDTPLPLVADTHPLTDSIQDETAATLHALIRALPPIFRDVIVLIDLHEWSYAEAAAVVDAPINTVRSRLFRARASLAHAWTVRENLESHILRQKEA